MAQVQGIKRFLVNGTEWSVGDSGSYDMGGPMRELQRGQTAFDHTLSLAPGAIEVQVMRRADQDLRTLKDTVDATVLLELRDGTVVTGTRMAFIGELNADAITGRFTARFEGDPLREVR